MRTLTYRGVTERHIEEAKSIVKICEKFGYRITEINASQAWIEYTLNCAPNAPSHWAHIPRGVYGEKFILNVMIDYCQDSEE
jgi:hypothetical protein